MNRTLAFVFAGMIGLAAALWAMAYMVSLSMAADSQVVISDTTLAAQSEFQADSSTISFSLFSTPTTSLYEADSAGAAGAYEFLQKKLSVSIEKDVRGIFSNSQVQENGASMVEVLPGKFAPKIRPQRVMTKEVANPFASSAQNKAMSEYSHYFFNQEIQGVPVYGSYIALHMKAENVYAVAGSIVKDETIEPAQMSEEEARQKAQQYATEDFEEAPKAHGLQRVLINLAVAGLSDDARTYPAIRAVYTNPQGPVVKSTAYFVSQVDGRLLYQQELIHEAAAISVCNYEDIQDDGSCVARTESTGPSPNAEIESIFQTFGTIYDYYSRVHSRDSYDGGGRRMNVIGLIPNSVKTSGGISFCPNASWSPDNEQFLICPGFGVTDILSHEYTHAIISHTAQLNYGEASGTINEGLADIFSTILDDDWLLGEDLSIGYLRDIANPSRNRSLVQTSGGFEAIPRPGPVGIFDDNFYCGTADSGGVHRNISAVSYAFYTMATGANIDGCQIEALGKEKALAIWYRAMTAYLYQTSNYLTVYQSMIQACQDLFGATSAECVSVTNALRAAEFDQQAAVTQVAPQCSAQVRVAPRCEVFQEPTPTPVVDPSPTDTVCNKSQGDADCVGGVRLVDFSIWLGEYQAGCTLEEPEKCGADEDADSSAMDADFNDDDRISLIDFGIWKNTFVATP